MKRFLVHGVVMCAALLAGSVFAANDRVVAVVNDQIITLGQLEARTMLNMRQAGMNNANADQRMAMRKRTLAGLIDEELQKQYAQERGTDVGNPELLQAKEVARERMGEAKWSELTKGYEKAADEKLLAEIRWQQILDRNIRPKVVVSDAEADKLIEDLAKSRHVLEREISMILLNPTEGKEDGGQLKKLQEIKERVAGGANFSEEAKAYSEDKSAVSGGALGWFASGELNPELEEALDKMQPGQVSEPIRTPMGWHLIKLENVRTTKPITSSGPVTQLELYMLATPVVSDTAAMEAKEKLFEEATKTFNKPQEVRDYFTKKQYGETFSASGVLGWAELAELQPNLQEALKDVKIGEWSGPVAIADTTARIYVAASKREVPAQVTAMRAKVVENIGAQRMELAARKFMRELRQKAFVDVRL